MVLYVCVCCESGFFVFMGGPGICIMFLFGPIANHTCLEEVSEEVRENIIKHAIYIYILNSTQNVLQSAVQCSSFDK